MRDLNLYGWIALIVVLVGGVNWLLVGLFGLDIVTTIFGVILGRLIFIGVGAATIYLCYLIYKEKMGKV